MTSVAIHERLKDAEVTEAEITEARNKYIPVAQRGAAMYFVVASMAEVDSMYQVRTTVPLMLPCPRAVPRTVVSLYMCSSR